MEITIHELRGTDALLCVYDGQSQAQGTYIELDIRDGEMRADYDPEIGNALPSTVYHGIMRQYPIPMLTAASANELMHRLVPLAERVVNGAELEWNGHDVVGVLNADAQRAEDEILDVIAEYEADLYWWDASEWLSMSRDEVVERLQSGATVEELVKEFDGDGGTEDTPSLIGLEQYLEDLQADIGRGMYDLA